MTAYDSYLDWKLDNPGRSAMDFARCLIKVLEDYPGLPGIDMELLEWFKDHWND